MPIVSLDAARAHVKADGDDDEALQQYLDGAIATAEDYCNRVFFVDEAAMLLAQASVESDTRAAYDTYYDTVEAIDDDAETAEGSAELASIAKRRTRAEETLRRSLQRIDRTFDGVVVTPNIVNAVLQITGCYYRERQDMTEVPKLARELLEKSVKIPRGFSNG